MLNIDREFLLAFENQLDPARPEAGKIPARVVGYGEISAVFAIEGVDGAVFKRLPPFATPAQRSNYLQVLHDYCRDLREHVGIRVIDYTCVELENRDAEHILYVCQPRLPEEAICNRIFHSGDEASIRQITEQLLRHLTDLWRRNREQAPALLLGIDAQLSNWAVLEPSGKVGESGLVYFDMTTPFVRRSGIEGLNTEIFLQSVPPFLVWIVRLAFLQQVLDRYYDFRSVLIDFAANLYKEKLGQHIPLVIETINEFLQTGAADLAVTPLQQKEIASYYREDAFIWTIFLAFRRFDRFLKTRLLKRKYNFILPGNIER